MGAHRIGPDGKYERLGDVAARGEYELIDPLDYLLLDKMKEEGTLFAGLYPLGDSTSNLAAQFKDVPGGLKSSVVSTRLRLMAMQDLVLKHDRMPGTNGQGIWQRTKSGTKVLNKWKREKGGTDEPTVS